MSIDGPNWGVLVEQGRAKANGVSWSTEEMVAIYEYKIPVEYVRGGCFTQEDYDKALNKVNELKKENKKKPLRYMNKEELLSEAKEVGIELASVPTRAELILLIEDKKINLESSLTGGDAIVQ